MIRTPLCCLAIGLLAVGACSTTGGTPPAAGGSVSHGATVAGAAERPGKLTLADVNRLIEDSWRVAQVSPAPVADDLEYLRRITLDLAGRVPTLAEAKAFVADASPDKRARLASRLLSNHEFAERWADLYGDLLYGREGKNDVERKYDPRSWLVRAFDENRSYDGLARQILAGSGDLRDNGALAFIVARARGMGGVEAVTGAAARIFLGLQIQCAQCHDHPYDQRWKQEDFYGLVAYFVQTKARREKADAPKAARLASAAEDDGPGMMLASGGMMAPARKQNDKDDKTYVVLDQGRGQAKMRKPRSEEDVTVKPRFLGFAPTVQRGETRRQTLARAIVASDLFGKAMVARTWAQLFGRGLADPWDDLGGENDPRHPALLNELGADFRASGFNIKRLVRLIVLSTAYQRSSAPAPPAPGVYVDSKTRPDDGGAAVRVFARAGMRPLSSEQLFRSLVVATGADDIARRRFGDAEFEKKMRQAFKEYDFAFSDDEMAEVSSFDGSVPQSLLLLNGELTNGATRAGDAGVLGRILAASKDPVARLDDLFLAAYTRRPSVDERREFGADLKLGGRRAYEDLFFALLTSTEAITNH